MMDKARRRKGAQGAQFSRLPASSYVKFVGSQEHPKAVIVLYGLVNSFYKKQAFKRGVWTVQMICVN